MQKWVQVLGSFSGLFLFEFLFFSAHSLETNFPLTLASEAVGEQAALGAVSAPIVGFPSEADPEEQRLKKGGL